VKKDPVQAVEWWVRAAEQGHADAMGNLGVMYTEGSGVPRNDLKGVDWLRRASAAGNVHAEYNLGKMYAEGRGVRKQSYKRAAEHYTKAADAGMAVARTALGDLYFAEHLVSSNKAGAAQAASYTTAKFHYQKAAKQGDQAAMLQLGEIYEHGLAVPQSFKTAREWYEKASHPLEPGSSGSSSEQGGASLGQLVSQQAAEGNAQAQVNLAGLYANARGVARDDRVAFEWYEKAADPKRKGGGVSTKENETPSLLLSFSRSLTHSLTPFACALPVGGAIK
jgi:TPR repeat protein